MKNCIAKEDIVRRAAKDSGESVATTERVMSAAIENIAEALSKGCDVKLAGLGIFEVKLRNQRTARNPKKNTSVIVPKRYMPTFRPSAELKEKVSSLEV